MGVEVVNYQLFYLVLLVLFTVFSTNFAIFFKSLTSSKRTTVEAFDGSSWLLGSTMDAWSSFRPQGIVRKGFDVSDFYFNIVMMLLGMFMVIVGTYYNAGFDLLNLYAGVSITAVDYYPWAFLFLVGGTTVVLINSFFSFLKLMD
jgi:hypothetical protein